MIYISYLIQVPNIVYHGTTTEHLLSLRKIDLSKCSKYADFGQGFYTTSNYRQALSFAKMRAKDRNIEEYTQKELFPNYNPIIVYPLVMEYYVDVKKLLKLSNLFFAKPNEKWAEFIYNNRVGLNYLKSDFHNWSKIYSFVYGHVADMAIAPLILDVKSAKINFEEFYKKIQPYDKKNGNQLSFHSYDAVNCLSLKNAEIGGAKDEKTYKGIC